MKRKEIIFIIEESLDGGYEARSVGESISTEAETIEELKKNIAKAVHCHFENDNFPLVCIQFLKNMHLN